MDYLIQSFGAVGDGRTLNTTAIQSAIDACSLAGGGRVVISDGVFMTGTIVLKSGVDLHIETGATLLGSPNCGEYDENSDFDIRPFPYNVILSGDIKDYGDYPEVPKKHVVCENLPRNRGCCLIFAEECGNISITGGGKIDANGTYFTELVPSDVQHYKKYRRIHAPTPPRIVFFTGCSGVKVEDITVTNGPAGWSFWVHDCDFVNFDRVNIICDLDYPNNDGIHINCSRYVTVSNCNIICSDDCIIVRANSRSLKENKVCENVTVTNCNLRTAAAGVRVAFVNDGVVRNCTFTGLVMTDSTLGVLLEIPDKNLIQSDYGREETLVENLRFSNIVMDRVLYPVLINLFDGEDTKIKAIRRLYFDGIYADCISAVKIVGTPSAPIEDIHFTNCEFRVENAADAIKLKHTRNICFNNTSVSTKD